MQEKAARGTVAAEGGVGCDGGERVRGGARRVAGRTDSEAGGGGRARRAPRALSGAPSCQKAVRSLRLVILST